MNLVSPELEEQSQASVVPPPSEVRHSCLLEKLDAYVTGNFRHQVLRKSPSQLLKICREM